MFSYIINEFYISWHSIHIINAPVFILSGSRKIFYNTVYVLLIQNFTKICFVNEKNNPMKSTVTVFRKINSHFHQGPSSTCSEREIIIIVSVHPY